MIRLSVQIEFDKTMELTTHKKSVVVGRSPKSDLVIPHDSISRQHCQIDYSKDKDVFYITDLGSSNGVTINGQRIPPSTKTLIPPNAALSLGKLECEISSAPGTQNSDNKVVSSDLGPGGDFTATIRLGRIELNKPSVTLELEKKPISKRPRNPVTYEPPVEVVKSQKTKWMLAIGLLILVIAWFMAPDKN